MIPSPAWTIEPTRRRTGSGSWTAWAVAANVSCAGRRADARAEVAIVHPPGPSPFLSTHLAALSPGRALDLACGSGRHAVLLAVRGWHVDALDRSVDRLRELRRRARTAGVTVRAAAVDLERTALPRERYDLIVNTRYLQRDLAGAIEAALRPGGVLVFETFTLEQRRFGKPRHEEFLLRPGELRGMFPGLRTLAYEEGVREVGASTPGGAATCEAVASLLAVREA